MNYRMVHERDMLLQSKRSTSVRLDPLTLVPIPFSVFPSAYRNAETQESTTVKVEGEAKVSEQASHGREGHEETHATFSATVNAPNRRDTHVKEEVRVYEEERLRRPQHREEVHIHEQTRFREPEQQRTQRSDRVEFQVSRDRLHFSLTSSSLLKLTFFPPPSYQPTSSQTHIEVQDNTYDRHFNTVHGPATDYAPSQIDVTERQFRERTRPIVAEAGYSKESFSAKHDSYPYRRQAQSVDSRYPAEVRVENTTRSTADAPKKYKRDMGYYDDDGQYHSFRHGIQKAAHKVADRIAHPIHPHRHHHHSHEHSYPGSKYDDSREEVIVKEKYTSTTPSVAPSRPVQSGAPVEKVVRVHSSSSVAPTSAPVAAPAPARAPVRKMASPNTITIPCHHIRIGDLLILQGRPCQVIRITTSSQTGQHRYLGVDLFTKQLHEESSFISNPAPSVVVQNMLGPVFKQYRVLDIREDGRVVAMTETGDVKQGLPVLDQSGLLSRLTESFDNGRGSVRILVINDDGLEMAVDYKVVHGSRL
ncbi:Nn.00g106320.m01.CDS01 [Neocucurbitaria sp. VM-36]